MQDEHSIENKMTSREFFTRFPTLHSFLLQQLQKAVSELETSKTRCVVMEKIYIVSALIMLDYVSLLQWA